MLRSMAVNRVFQGIVGGSILFCSHIVLAAPVPVETSALDRSLRADTNIGLGFTTSVAQRPFIGVDNQSTSLPYVVFGYKNFYIEGLNVGYKLLDKQDMSVEFLATPRFYEVKSTFADNGELNGIGETRPTYLFGVSAQYRLKPATLTLQALADIPESEGNEIIATASKAFKLGPAFTIVPAVGVTYQDADLVDHFYGVQANEVAANRNEYSGNGSTNYHLSLTTIWDAGKHIQLLGQVKYEALGSGITDSPIVDEDSIVTAVVGAVFLF